MKRSTRSTCHRFEIGDVTVALRADRPDVISDFASLYHACASPGAGGGRVINIEVRRSSRWRRRYDVVGDGRTISTNRTAAEVLPHLEWAINRRVIAARSEFIQLHAATLVREGRGLILAGPSGAGKSTLSAGLLARGWTYLSDEFALINARTGLLHPFPKALCVKEGSFPIMRRLGLPLFRARPYIKACKGKLAYLPPQATPAASTPCPVGLVMFPRYSGHETPRLAPITRSKAAFRLACHMMNRPVYGHRAVPVLGRVVADAKCYALETGELEATCDLIASRATERRGCGRCGEACAGCGAA